MISGSGGQPLGGAYSTLYSPDKVMAKEELAEQAPLCSRHGLKYLGC